ncbi:hypothetical protein ACOME3_003310 [Neoechinorhynchus agilis]
MGRRSGGGGRPFQSRRSTSLSKPNPSSLSMPSYKSPQQPGLFGQMASTAAGVALGSSIGHAAGAALVGGSNSYPGGGAVAPSTQYQSNPCMQQIQDFLKCVENNNDISLCQGFNDALKECKFRYGL